MGAVRIRPIPGFDGLYSVTDIGAVWARARSWRNATGPMRHDGKWMNPTLDSTGYFRVRLTDKNGKRSFPSIHRLVALAFIPNRKRLQQINHKDGVKTNNAYTNLEWCDARHNNLHAFATGLNKTVGQRRRKLGARQVRALRKMVNDGSTFTAAAERYGLDRSTATAIAKWETYVEIR